MLLSRFIIEQPHSVGWAWLCYISTQAQLQQEIKTHWSRSVYFFSPFCPSQKAALHQNSHYTAVNCDTSLKDECGNPAFFLCCLQVGWHLDYWVSQWVHPVRDLLLRFWFSLVSCVCCVAAIMWGTVWTASLVEHGMEKRHRLQHYSMKSPTTNILFV